MPPTAYALFFPSSPQLDHLVRLLSTVAGTDKLLMVAQFTSRLVAFHLLKTKRTNWAGVAKRLSNLAGPLEDVRYVLRYYALLPMIQYSSCEILIFVWGVGIGELGGLTGSLSLCWNRTQTWKTTRRQTRDCWLSEGYRTSACEIDSAFPLSTLSFVLESLITTRELGTATTRSSTCGGSDHTA